MSTTGFVIVAYLILWTQHIEYPIPFATMEACEIAEAHYKEWAREDRVHCVWTGARPASK